MASSDATEPPAGSDEWATWRRTVDLDADDERWRAMARAGDNPHGEADLVSRYGPRTVLDAGCGTGRLAIELAQRGMVVVGVDLDPDLLARAKDKAPEIEWVEGDLSHLDLDRVFDVVVAAGNVFGFIASPVRAAALRRSAAHVDAGGRLIAGWQLRSGWPTLDQYDEWCTDAGLELEDRYATWDGEPMADEPGYAVSIHRRPPAP